MFCCSAVARCVGHKLELLRARMISLQPGVLYHQMFKTIPGLKKQTASSEFCVPQLFAQRCDSEWNSAFQSDLRSRRAPSLPVYLRNPPRMLKFHYDLLGTRQRAKACKAALSTGWVVGAATSLCVNFGWTDYFPWLTDSVAWLWFKTSSARCPVAGLHKEACAPASVVVGSRHC